jgi:hypothetical protein
MLGLSAAVGLLQMGQSAWQLHSPKSKPSLSDVSSSDTLPGSRLGRSAPIRRLLILVLERSIRSGTELVAVDAQALDCLIVRAELHHVVRPRKAKAFLLFEIPHDMREHHLYPFLLAHVISYLVGLCSSILSMLGLSSPLREELLARRRPQPGD